MALAKDTGGVFKCGISVAPVTDWIYYGKSIFVKLDGGSKSRAQIGRSIH